MDNKKLSINGSGSELLKRALQFALLQESMHDGEEKPCCSWSESKEHGLILSWYEEDGFNKLPAPLTSEALIPLIEAWLAGDFAKQVTPNKGSEDLDQDGDNEIGWEIYCEDWGHVGECHTTICAIKPAYLWYGR